MGAAEILASVAHSVVHTSAKANVHSADVAC
jgi:hypothetical protein